ncbi:MAG: response regulator [Phycisphaerales bacterium]|nr:MAG: response regulator [Phycisphaerales bacterium]
MVVDRPKLLIITGPELPGSDLAKVLSDRFDVTVSDAQGQGHAVREPSDAVLASTDRLPMLVAELANDRAITLLNAIGEGVCLSTGDGRFLWMNDFFAGLDAGTQSSVATVCREASAWFGEEARRRERQRRPGSRPEPEEATPAAKFELTSPDESRFFEVFISPVPTRGGAATSAPEQVAVAVRDVTAARRFRRKMDAIDRAGSELVSLEAEELKKMNAMERVRFIEQKIVQFTRDLLNFDHFAIFLVEAHRNKLELVISSGLPKEIQDLDLFIGREGSGISGMVAATGRSYLCTDAGNDERYIPGLPGCRSSLTVPLRLHDKVIGVLDVESRTPGAFTKDDQQFAEIFARHIAIALHMLDLLVSERCSTNEAVSGRVQGELDEPLDDILHEADVMLQSMADADPEGAAHLQRIRADVEAIRSRMKDVAGGPQTLLGVERAMQDTRRDPAFEGRRVLIADDAAKIRRVIGDVLRHRGCEVTVCEDGAEAIVAIEHEREAFDLIISDIKMPDRNGYEVFAAAQKKNVETPVILMTGFGYDPHHSIVRASQEGLQSVLFKPFEIEQLLEQVRAVFTEKQRA